MWHNPPLAQAALAHGVKVRGVNLDQAAISRIENRTRNVSDYELIAIAQCLNVSVESLCSSKSGRNPLAGRAGDSV